MKTFTLKARFICMHILCLLFAVMPQQMKAQGMTVEPAHFNGAGMNISDVTLADPDYKLEIDGVIEEGAVDDKATRILLYNMEKDMFLNAGGYWGTRTAIEGITSDITGRDMPMAVYNLQGQAVRRGTTSLAGLPNGMYIVNGKKMSMR